MQKIWRRVVYRYDRGTQIDKQLPLMAFALTWPACGIVCKLMREAPGTDCGMALDR